MTISSLNQHYIFSVLTSETKAKVPDSDVRYQILELLTVAVTVYSLTAGCNDSTSGIWVCSDGYCYLSKDYCL